MDQFRCLGFLDIKHWHLMTLINFTKLPSYPLHCIASPQNGRPTGRPNSSYRHHRKQSEHELCALKPLFLAVVNHIMGVQWLWWNAPWMWQNWLCGCGEVCWRGLMWQSGIIKYGVLWCQKYDVWMRRCLLDEHLLPTRGEMKSESDWGLMGGRLTPQLRVMQCNAMQCNAMQYDVMGWHSCNVMGGGWPHSYVQCNVM